MAWSCSDVYKRQMTAACTMSVSSFNVQVQAEGRVEAVVIPAVCLSTLVRDNLYVENFLYRGATQHFSQVLTAVEQMLFRTLEQRLAAYLLEECERLGTDTLKVTQEQMAQALSLIHICCGAHQNGNRYLFPWAGWKGKQPGRY